jgi:hypothetical protein
MKPTSLPSLGRLLQQPARPPERELALWRSSF